MAEKQRCRRPSAIADCGSWSSSQWSKFLDANEWTAGRHGIAFARNSIGDLFVATQGGGVFRSTDKAETWTGINNGDTWTEQNTGFTAFDVNSVVISAVGHIFAGAAGGVFGSLNNADQWSDVSSGLLPPDGNVWAVAIGRLPPEDLPMPELLAAVYFEASVPLSRGGF